METNTPSSSENVTPLFDAISRWCLLILIVVATVGFIPMDAAPFQFTKTGTIALLTFIALVVFVVARLQVRSITLPVNALLFSLLGISGAYILSFLFSPSAGSFWGDRLTPDTAGFILVAVLAGILTAIVLRSKTNILSVYVAMLFSFGIIALYHLVRIVFGPNALVFGIFDSPTSGPFGLLNELGMFFGLIGVLSLVTLVSLRLPTWPKVLVFTSLIVSILFLTVTNVAMVWWGIGLTALGSLVYSVLKAQAPHEDMEESNESGLGIFTSLGVLAISLIFLFGSEGMTSSVATWLNLGQIDIRPSWQTTLTIGRDALKENAIFGAGPTSFESVWAQHRPMVTNQTIAWNTDFTSAIGFVPTSIISTGIVGLLAWLVFFGFFIYTGIRTLVLRSVGDPLAYYLSFSSYLGASYLWILAILTVPNATLIFFAFMLTGVFIASLRHRNNELVETSLSFATRPRLGFLSVLVLILIVLGSVASMFSIGEKYAAATYFQSALIRANVQGDIPGALDATGRALVFDQQDSMYRFASALDQVRMQDLLVQNPEPNEQVRQQFQSLLASSIQYANRATEIDPNNYQNWLQLGNIYRSIVPIGIEGAFESAERAYQRANELRPNSPAILYEQAQLELARNDRSAAKVYIEEALNQRAFFTEAIFLLAQIQIADGEIEPAIQSVEAATIIDPNNPVAYFQLGLLHYSQENYEASARAFEQATTINTVYANARYFLGLSYYWLNRPDDAIAQFELIRELNPENQELPVIISRMQNGENPFEGGPATIPPEEPEPNITELDGPPLPDDDIESTDSSAIIRGTPTTPTE